MYHRRVFRNNEKIAFPPFLETLQLSASELCSPYFMCLKFTETVSKFNVLQRERDEALKQKDEALKQKVETQRKANEALKQKDEEQRKANEALEQKLDEAHGQKDEALNFIKSLAGLGDSVAGSAFEFLKSRGLGWEPFSDAKNEVETEPRPGDDGVEGYTV